MSQGQCDHSARARRSKQKGDLQRTDGSKVQDSTTVTNSRHGSADAHDEVEAKRSARGVQSRDRVYVPQL